MPTGSEAFSNPVAPPSHRPDGDEDEHRLTNADFRSLLMTPRAQPKVPPPKQRLGVPKEYAEADDANAKRRKKKLYYAKLRQQEEERQKELNAKYRDRATERREGKNTDYQHNDAPDLAKTAEYRAVAPTADQVNSAAERRRLAIQESKFLGGDMEHTHLVKGLDFALLQKVRSEIVSNESEEIVTETKSTDKKEETGPDVEFVSVIGRKIYKAATSTKPPARNDLFLPGRMAYLFNLDDEYEESEIPTTTIRSKADCPLIEHQTTLTTNDIVINKLTQILSYLRQGMRASKKLKKREKELIRAGKDPRADESIYNDVGDYNPGSTLENYRSHEKLDHQKSTKAKYFNDKDRDYENKGFSGNDTSVKDFVKNITDKYGSRSSSEWREVTTSGHALNKKSKNKAKQEVDSYAECYPGAAEMDDAVNDSDDDADYTKMDMGSKKGPLKRWDFESEDDYNRYMENKEAMPKAAFQFGIKMQEGRKTRTKPGHMSEKQKLDREWQQISNLIAKRKSDSRGDTGGKKSRY